jgi:hypothetical protein
MTKNAAILLSTAAAGLGWSFDAAPVRAAGANEVPKEIIAVQIRKQGFECKTPLSAERDPEASKPDDAAWILRCDGVSYKVRLVPNMAAKVERLPDDRQSSQDPAKK